MTYILPLAHDTAPLEMVGGKGMSLSKLISAGIPVPDGFHVTTEAYRVFVEQNKIGPRITELIRNAEPENNQELESISRKIDRLFFGGKMPREIEPAIRAAYDRLGNTTVAVRSSATAEDLPDASFAGQQETYLNIQGLDEVVNSIKRCWGSLWTARAIAYRLVNKIEQENIALAVVVQNLVFSDASGVMFTLNPINGKRSELFINAAWGLGEAVVSSLVTPDSIIVDKGDEHIISYETAEKQVMTVRTGNGTTEVSTAKPLMNKRALTRRQIQELARLGKRIEEHYNSPMDVEWAIEKGKVYIVQARPITVLPVEWVLPEKDVIYTKGSLAEHLPSPVSPLFASLGLELVNDAASLLWEEMFGKAARKLLPENGAYAVINGYAYLSAKAKPALIAVKSFSPRALKKTVVGSIQRHRAAQEEFDEVLASWEEKSIETMSEIQLMEGIRAVFGAACNYFTSIQLVLPSASISETLFTKLAKNSAARTGIQDTSVFLLGYDTIALDSEKNIFEIGEWVKNNRNLRHYLKDNSAAMIEKDFAVAAAPSGVTLEVWAEWRQRLNRYLHEFGGTVYEYDFIFPTPQELLTPIIETMKIFAAGKGESPFLRQANAVKQREEAERAVLKRIRGPKKMLFKKLLNWAQLSSPMREDAIYTMGKGHPLIRRMFAELGKRLVGGGAITAPEHIYWLEKDELEKMVLRLDKGLRLEDMMELIRERQAEREKFRTYVPPHTLPEKKKKMGLPRSAQKDGETVLTGVGASPGIVTAPAHVLHGPEDFAKFQPGSVLVAVTTTPAWTPLFASASAVVTDIGGPLSHSSIVAREYGIPAVMAVHAASRTIKTGQMITVDGTKGMVTLKE